MTPLYQPDRLVAILRGIEPAESEAFVTVLREAGFRQVEVPLNSPSPLDSVERLQRRFGSEMQVGVGTVTQVEQAKQAIEAGATWILSPMLSLDLLDYCEQKHIRCIPGVATPTEAFSAIAHGADTLKVFPADALGANFLSAIKTVLPPSTRVMAVGGVQHEELSLWREAGADAIGCGNALYQKGMSLTVFRQRVEAWTQACNEIWPALDASEA